jgi:hypothetical protein
MASPIPGPLRGGLPPVAGSQGGYIRWPLYRRHLVYSSYKVNRTVSSILEFGSFEKGLKSNKSEVNSL